MATDKAILMDDQCQSDKTNNSDNSPNVISCPKPLLPDGFLAPQFPNNDYYKPVPNDQMDQISGIKNKALNAASEKKEGDFAKALEDFNIAKDLYAKANRDLVNSKHLLVIKSINNKIELLRVFKEKLLTLLPKGGLASGKENAPIEERVPADKLAVCVAELNKALTDEDLDYLKKKNDIKLKFEDSENLWKKSEISYRTTVCEAKLLETQSIDQAEVVWRSSISDLLKALKN